MDQPLHTSNRPPTTSNNCCGRLSIHEISMVTRKSVSQDQNDYLFHHRASPLYNTIKRKHKPNTLTSQLRRGSPLWSAIRSTREMNVASGPGLITHAADRTKEATDAITTTAGMKAFTEVDLQVERRHHLWQKHLQFSKDLTRCNYMRQLRQRFPFEIHRHQKCLLEQIRSPQTLT